MNLIKKSLLVVCGLIASGLAFADSMGGSTSQDNLSISAFQDSLPGRPIFLSWLPGIKVIRMKEESFELSKAMPAIREQYEQWCKSRNGKIFQPRTNNCVSLQSGLGCAVGELQYPGLKTDFELGLISARENSNDGVQVNWPKASWLISKNDFFNLFINKSGTKQFSIVGGLQRCVGEQSTLLNAMAFVSINGNNDLVFLEPNEYESWVGRGKAFKIAKLEKEEAEAKDKRAQEIEAVAALSPGKYVTHIRTGWRGLIIEMRPPLAQIQWDKGTKSLEWNRLDELKAGVER